jgi:hypothetical protein
MALSFQAAHNVDAVSPFFKGPEEVDEIHLTRAGEKNDLYIARIL